MPTDKHGVTHTGAIGLFDDEDEFQASIERAERHERERLETQIRRQERRDKRQERKEAQVTNKEPTGKARLLPPFSWLGKIFHKGGKPRVDAASTASSAGATEDESEPPARGIRKTTEYVVVRRPSTPEIVYTAQDVDAIDSPWLRECGMVRVKSDDVGGCHIVSKSSIQKSE